MLGKRLQDLGVPLAVRAAGHRERADRSGVHVHGHGDGPVGVRRAVAGQPVAGQGQVRDALRVYAYGEKTYLVPSLVAKSVLAWQIFAGSLAG